MARPDNFLSNFEPLTSGEQARILVERITEFDEFTPPHAATAPRAAAEAGNGYVVCSAHPRLSTASRARTRATSRPGPT